MQYNKGIGLMASIIILAVVALGGFAAVRVASNNSAEVDTQEAEETLALVRADVESTLADVSADLTVNTEATVNAAISELIALSVRIEAAADTVEGGVRAELQALRENVDNIVVTLESNVAEARADIEVFLEGIEVETTGGGTADINIGVGEDAADDNGGASVDGEGETNMEAGESGAEVESSGSVEINL